MDDTDKQARADGTSDESAVVQSNGHRGRVVSLADDAHLKHASLEAERGRRCLHGGVNQAKVHRWPERHGHNVRRALDEPVLVEPVVDAIEQLGVQRRVLVRQAVHAQPADALALQQGTG